MFFKYSQIYVTLSVDLDMKQELKSKNYESLDLKQ